MPRPPRLQVAGGVYHLTSRGNAKATIYLDDIDRRTFLANLRNAIRAFEWNCFAYCLMDNHYHLLVETPLPNLSPGMRFLNSAYARHFNRRYERTGHLFQGRFGAELVSRDAHMLEIARYIALNPVRAGICESPDDWPWSSYRATGSGTNDDLVAVDRILAYFGDDKPSAQSSYVNFIAGASPSNVKATLGA